jgi:glycosyltransferase involved in cell wall biosynthesis
MTTTVAPVNRPAAPIGGAVRRRVCLLSEDLSGPPDEGCKKLTMALAAAVARHHEVALLSTQGSAPAGGRLVPASRTFLSAALRRELRRLDPELLVYVARSSTTFMSFVRSRVLRALCPRALVVLVGLQARRHTGLRRRLIGRLAPELIFVQSPRTAGELERLGCSVALLPSGVDLETFRPVGADEKRRLRAEQGLQPDLPVLLHVGHLQRARGIGVLADLAGRGGCQVVLAASSSTPQEGAVADELRRAGVVVRTAYEPRIEQLYQLADCYVFPVQSTDNAIELPLSVLEAFACDLPVVTTRFGGLPRLFDGSGAPGLRFVDSPTELIDEALRLCRIGAGATRSLALPYAWDAVADNLIDRAVRLKETIHV